MDREYIRMVLMKDKFIIFSHSILNFGIGTNKKKINIWYLSFAFRVNW